MYIRGLAGSIRPLLLALSTAGVAKSAGIKAELLRFDCYFFSLNCIGCRPKDRPTLRSSSVGIPCLRSRRNEIFMLGLHGGIRASAYVLMHEYARWPDRKSTRLNSSHVRISYAVF